MKKYIRDYLTLLVISGSIVILDQWTKTLVRTQVPFGQAWSPYEWLAPYARIVHWKNAGAAFGILQGFRDIFTILAILVAIAIIYYYPKVPRENWYIRLALALQLGGALGNLTDRLTHGYVTDFISIGNFPVWNVADACISLGVAILIVGMWLQERKPKPSDEPSTPENINPSVPEELQGE
ncbi:MAG: signal peptidase II [Anaerolineales bacterium]|nr:signal peptidase II [Anaerolineales bacterium]